MVPIPVTVIHELEFPGTVFETQTNDQGIHYTRRLHWSFANKCMHKKLLDRFRFHRYYNYRYGSGLENAHIKGAQKPAK